MPVYAITGANRGLGLEFVRQISPNASNTILALTRSKSSDLSDVESLNKEKNIHVLECDTSSLESINTFAEHAGKILGSKKIDFLLNNGGINARPEQNSLTIGPKDLEEHIRVNVTGPAKTTEALLEAGLLSDNAVITNMSSSLGSNQLSGQGPRKCATYSISKAALNMLTVHQAEDIKAKLPSAVVISMDPGWVKTRMGGEGAQIDPHVSIGGMLKTLNGLKKEDTGKFFTYTGEELPW